MLLHVRSLICVEASAILWYIWLCRNDVTFEKKKVILLFAGYFQGDLLDSFLEHPVKGEQQTGLDNELARHGSARLVLAH